jgi:hypothetical protein
MRLAAVAAAATAAAVVAPTHALTNCTNSYAENFNPSCTPPCADDGSCEYPNDPSACEGELLRNVAVRVSVTDADFEFRWAIDDSMMSPHRYGPFSNFGGGGAGGRGAAEMVLCVDGGNGGSDGRDHSLKYMGGGGGFIEIQGLEAAACPQAGEESCVLSPTQYFDPQDQVPPVRFHVGLSPPPPPLDPDVECSLKYVDVFMEFQAGQTCDRRNGCTEACQQSITEVLRICRNQTYAGGSPAQCINDKGSAVECKLKDDESACSSDSPDCTYTEHGPARTFDESAVEGFQKIGPIDCDYSLGYEVCSHARTHARNAHAASPPGLLSERDLFRPRRSLANTCAFAMVCSSSSPETVVRRGRLHARKLQQTLWHLWGPSPLRDHGGSPSGAGVEQGHRLLRRLRNSVRPRGEQVWRVPRQDGGQVPDCRSCRARTLCDV